MEYFTKKEMIRCYRESKKDRCAECRLQQAVKRMPDGIDENMEALVDNRMKDMELAKQYVEEFIKHIVKPLEARVDELANKVKDLTDAVEQIANCPHSADCPVRDELRKQQGDSHK